MKGVKNVSRPCVNNGGKNIVMHHLLRVGSKSHPPFLCHSYWFVFPFSGANINVNPV